MIMSQEEYFEWIDNSKDVKEFLKKFGGEFIYSLSFGYVYNYGKQGFSMMFNDFEKDIKKSIEKDENILMTYPQVK